ncbi:MAG: Flp pilus assembly protein CpaB [Bdellovibrionales bacterium]|nr:Flp pilus assembly protein CpaB [Bdellovibrionales bacterium]
MNTRAFTLAMVIAFGAMFMVYTYIEDQKNVLIKKFGNESSVVVAKVDIKELDLIDDSKVQVISVPNKFRAPGHFKTIKAVENTVAAVPILKGEQITKPRVIFPGARTGLSRQISVGKRAISILINARTAISKLIKPGDRVDIIAKISYSGGARIDLNKMRTIMEDVLVLSTGTSMTNSIPMVGIKVPKVIRTMKLNTYAEYNVVTLELDPLDAQKLAFLVQNIDPLPYLSLRNNNDKDIHNFPPTKLLDLLTDRTRAEAKDYFKEKYKKK